jgi:undecaprenyl-diphosphatase
LLKIAQSEFIKSFEIAIQLGAILAVVVLYWRQLILSPKIIKRLICAFIPTAAIGVIFYKIIKAYLLATHQIVLWALFLGGIFLIIFEMFYREKKEAVEDLSAISYPQAMLIGVFQSIAMIPGVSRAAATIYGGLFLGLKRRTIVEFSFLLAVPTMLAATGLDLYKSAGNFSLLQFRFLAISFIVSFLVAILSIKFLLNFIKKNNFIAFGVYRIIIALAFWLFVR